MNFPIKISIVLSILFFAANQSSAQDGLSLLSIEAGARPAGMGGAFVSISGEPNGSFYNPAIARGSKTFLASFGHNTFLEDIRLETGYFLAPLGKSTTIHGGIRYAKVSQLEFRNGPTSAPLSLFEANDVSIKVGASYDITNRISAGLSAGWFLEKIEAWRGTAFNIDLGVLVNIKDSLMLGGSISNIGSDLILSKSELESSRNIPLPLIYRFGMSYQFSKYLGAADLVIINDVSHLHFGAESYLHKAFALRAGLMTGYSSKNFTAGASFVRRNLTIDYAFVPYSNNLGTSHLFNFTFGL